MLFRLILFRMGPMVLMQFCKERKCLKGMLALIFFIYAVCFVHSVSMIFASEKWKALLLVPFSMVPQFFFYGFAGWILFRCVFEEWSQRVWKRIYRLSCFSVFIGFMTEFYINPQILKFFVKNF